MVKAAEEPRVSIVIPNWNGVYLMEKHLTNVIKAAPTAEIVVADDMSTDGSVEYLRKNFPKVKVAVSAKREGFAANVDAGVAASRGKIIVLLNTDVEPEGGFLVSLLRHFDDPAVFAVGCLEKSQESGKTVLRGRGLAHWDKGYFIHARGEVNKSDTAWVSGGSGAFRRSMWDELGGMDTLYNPFYWEDIDLSYRARKAGWKTLFDEKSIVHHYHEEGKIKREFSPVDVKRIAYRNQYIFIWKNVSDWSILLAHAFWTPIRLFQAMVSGDFLMIEGYCMAITRLPAILSRRMAQKHLYKLSDREVSMWD